MPPSAISGLSSGRITSSLQLGASSHVVPERLAVDGERVRVRQQAVLAQAAQHGRQAAGVVELLHQEAARGHQVHDGRHAAAEAGPVLQFQRHADAPGDRLQVDHGVGRAADRGVDPDRVLERRAGQDLRQRQSLAHHLARCACPTSAPARSGARRRPGSRRCAAARRPAPRPCRPWSRPCPWCCRCRPNATCRASADRNSCRSISPALSDSCSCHTAVPEPMSRPSMLAVEHRTAADARWPACRSSPRPSAAPAWSCRSRPAAPRRRSGCRGSLPRRPCWRGCG